VIRTSNILAGLAVAAALLGCSSTPAPGVPPPPDNFIDWARGPGAKAPKPATGDRRLLLHEKLAPIASARPAHPKCFSASAFLPAPAPDPRIFFLDGRNLSVRLAEGADPVPVDGFDPALRVQHILGFVRSASPLTMLVAALPEGARGVQFWELAIGGSTLQSMKQVTGAPAFAAMAAFFERYHVPRCLEGNKRCLSASHADGWFLDVQATPDSTTPETLEKLGDLPVFDAAWAAPDGSRIYLLVPCA
jgi:hypothetical protein